MRFQCECTLLYRLNLIFSSLIYVYIVNINKRSVLVPADKTVNNVAAVWRFHYSVTLKKELDNTKTNIKSYTSKNILLIIIELVLQSVQNVLKITQIDLNEGEIIEWHTIS